MGLELLFENTIGFVYGVLGFVIMMSLVVFVHEFGHYYAARLCGVKVDIFSIGFGKKIFSHFDKNGCQWTLSYLPLGGYVKFFGDKSGASDPDSQYLENMSEEEKRVSFYHKNLWQKLFVVIAGPAANVIFCLFVLSALYFLNGLYKVEPIIMGIDKGRPAYEAGLLEGDYIRKVNGGSVETAGQVAQNIIGSFGRPVSITVMRDGKNITFENIIPDEKLTERGDKIPYIGIHFSNVPYILSVQRGFPAAEAGLKSWDKVISVNGAATPFTTDVIKAVQETDKEVIQLEVERAGNIISLGLRPIIVTDKHDQKKPQIGIMFVVPKYQTFEYDIVRSIKEAYRQTLSIAVLSWDFFVGLFKGYADAEQLSGPIKIGSIAGDALQNDGIMQFIYIMAFISMSIGLVNLAPVPMLDGGHIVMYSFELITGIKPSKKFQEYAFKFGFSLVMVLMVFTILNDVGIVSYVKKLS